ncbi:MAG: SGNH/GDSL hydrolase family protein [candidate division Zixibacteria bacterium]|nr:SGNH/GDSL hydrolase family protein [candidate division Zixibacteria bacterium]
MLSIPAFIFIIEIIFSIIPVNTYFENRFFIVNRSLDYTEVFKRDPYLFWRFRSSQTITSQFFEGKRYHINSLGLRDKEIPAPSDKIRIAALGNSCTFGWGLPDSETYIKQTEWIINNDSSLPRVETINAGIPGYSSFQGRRFFISDISGLRPDIILIMFAWNDQWAAADNIPDNEQKPPPKVIVNIQNLFSRLKIYRLIKKLILSMSEGPLLEKLIKKSPVYRVSFVDFYDNLNTIVNYARSRHIIPILLTSPIPSLEKYYPPGRHSMMHLYHEYYNMQTRLLARNTQTPLIDIAKEFDNYNYLYDDAPQDPIHFNVKGHHLAAQLIYKYLKANPELISHR